MEFKEQLYPLTDVSLYMLEMKNRTTQQKPISLLTNENIEELKKHCIRVCERGYGRTKKEHEITLEMIYRYEQLENQLNKFKEQENIIAELKKEKQEVIDKLGKDIERLITKEEEIGLNKYEESELDYADEVLSIIS